MATPIIMPRQGQSVESCIISKWHKKKGDNVAAGDILFSYETDKASFEEDAKAAGTMLDIFFEEGDDVPCLTNVCVIGNPGESTAEFNPNGGATGPAIAAPAADTGAPGLQNRQEAASADAGSTANTSAGALAQPADDTELKISPRARKLAEKTGVDYRYAAPSGPCGRIIEKDIVALRESGFVFTASARAQQLAGQAGAAVSGTGLGGRITTADLAGSAAGNTAAGNTAADAARPGDVDPAAVTGAEKPIFDEVRVPNIRKVIAKAMHQSLSTMAQLTLNTSYDVTDVIEFRKKLKESKERLGLENITINDIIIYAVSRTLANHKDLNAHFLDDRMLYFRNVNVGVAVDTERGLMVPTVFNANLKSLNEISAEVKKLVKECQAGTINPDLLKNGSFTVTNLGIMDIESFTPVINPPQTGILGANNIMQKAREADGEIEFYPAMGLSLTFDHRAVDGAPAARFLKELKTNLENFSTLLVK